MNPQDRPYKTQIYHYKDPTSLSRPLVILLAICIINWTISGFNNLYEYQLYTKGRGDVLPTSGLLNNNAIRQMLIGSITLLCHFITMIVFCLWTYRISSNAHHFSGSTQRHPPSWSVGSYFVPIVNLWHPYQALWDAHKTFINTGEKLKSASVFQFWWTAWFASGIIGLVVFRKINTLNQTLQEVDKSLKPSEIWDTLMEISLAGIGSNIFSIFLNLFAIKVIQLVTNSCVKFQRKNDLPPPLLD